MKPKIVSIKAVNQSTKGRLTLGPQAKGHALGVPGRGARFIEPQTGPGPLPQFKDCVQHADREKGTLMMEKVLDIIGGKWKMLVLFHLGMNGTVRFGELKRKIPGVTQRMLTLTLREMEKDGIVSRKVYPEVPPKVEYRLTDEGADLKEVYITMGKWGFKHAKMLEESKEKVSGQ